MKNATESKSKGVEPMKLVRQIVDQHRKTASDLGMRMAIWLNPNEQNLWQNGIELVEICENAVPEADPDFRSSLMQPRWGRPGLKYILTSPREMNFDLHLNGGASFYDRLRSQIRRGEAVVVFPNSKRSPVEMLEGIMGLEPVES